MTQHLVPDKVLDLWARGVALAEIVATVRDRAGRPFTAAGIKSAIFWARQRGDPRAVKRGSAPRTKRKIKGAWPYTFSKPTGERGDDHDADMHQR